MTRLGVLAVVVVAAVFAGAKCYREDTRVIVFLQGYYTHLDANGTAGTGVEERTFDTLKASFLARGYAATDFLDYSYNGGAVDGDGAWDPADYACGDTDRRSEEHLVHLERMLRDYRREHPGTHFALVGHSLGGYLAFLEGAREAERADDDRLDIDVVVTLDAPLKGVDVDKKIILDSFVPCEVKTYVAGAEIVAAKLDAGTPALRAAQAAAMAEAGIRVATLGNENDCLFALNRCLGPQYVDDGATQTLPGQAAVATMYPIVSNPFLSHVAILADATVVQDAATFVGAP